GGGFVRLVLEQGHGPAARVVADGADEGHDRALAGAGDQRLDRARVEDVGRHGEALRRVTAAHWWDDRQLVAVLEDVVGADVLLVHHQHHGPGEAVEGRRIRQGGVVAIPGGAAFGNLELSLTGSKLL